jgi:hypothetical protein
VDPAVESFTLNSSYGSVGPVTNDLGMDAWTTAVTGGPLDYDQLLTPQQQAQVDGSDWILSVTLRVVQSSSSSDISTSFATGSQYFSLGFGLDGGGDPFVQAGDSSLSPVYTLTGAGSSYNNYELIYNSANTTASLWVNGVDVINNRLYG